MRQFDGEGSGSRENTPNNDHLRFKPKVSNTEEASSSTPNSGTRICEFCGKEFANGKALGGHIRIHNQNTRSKAKAYRIVDGPKLWKNDADVLSGFERRVNWEKEQICRLCNRTFPSVKSLFGHMRFHPERNYRGVRPLSSEEQTRTVSSTSEESEQETEVTRRCHGERDVLCSRDLLKDLPNWSKTDKRGRQSTSEAAHSLMKLSFMASRDESDEFPPGFCNQKYKPESPPKKLKVEDGRDVELKRKHVQVQVQESGHKQVRPHKGVDPNIAGEVNTDHTDIGPSQPQRKVRFQCYTCGRVFPTFQALGGHRSSHNKDKGTTTPHNLNSPRPVLEASAAAEITAATATAATLPAASLTPANKDEAAGGTPSTASGVHHCGICWRKLDKGHKRCHWPTFELATGEGSGQGNNTGQLSLGLKYESSQGDQACQVGTKGTEIDLNKPPPAEDEDGPTSRLKPPQRPTN